MPLHTNAPPPDASSTLFHACLVHTLDLFTFSRILIEQGCGVRRRTSTRGPINLAWELSLTGAVVPDKWRPPYFL